MKAEYLVEEKLERIEAVIQGLRPSHDGYITQAVGLLRDYYERIKADEGAVPDLVQHRVRYFPNKDWQIWMDGRPAPICGYERARGRCEVEVRELFAHPPAQAVVTDAIVQRAEQAFWPVYSECKRVHGARKDAHATGMRAALLAVWPNPPAQAEQGEVFMHVLASLIAAVSLLRHGGRKAASSDTMFAFMLSDYEKAIKAGRAMLAAPHPGEPT